MMLKRILVVGGGQHQIPLIEKARNLGMTTVALDPQPQAPAFAFVNHAVTAPFSEEAIIAAARTHSVDGILPGSESVQTPVARAAKALGLPGPSPEAAERLFNRYTMRLALTVDEGSRPLFRREHSAPEAEAAAGALGLPVVARPADGPAGMGVQCVIYPEDVSLAFYRAQRYSDSGAVLIEESMAGSWYGVDGFVEEGTFAAAGVTGYERREGPYPVVQAMVAPAPVTEPVRHAIIEATRTAFRRIGLTWGAVHADVVFTDEGPRIWDLCGQIGGAPMSRDLFVWAYGLDYLADCLRAAVGEPRKEAVRFHRGAALCWIPAHPGIVREVRGLEAAHAVPGIEQMAIAAKPGDVLYHVVDQKSRERTGYVLAAAHTADAALAAAKQACDLCRMVTTATHAAP